MSWTVIAASEVGTSHVTNGRNCEDSCWAQVDTTPTGQPLLSMFVADGAGSAARGGDGAELAIQAAAAFIQEKLKLPEFGLGDDFAVDCIKHVRTQLAQRASSEQLKVRDFACTFLGIVSSSNGTVAFQIGDGGIVLDIGNGLEVSIVPMAGEYANMTYFITDEDAVTNLEIKTYHQRALRVAMFSDGLQRLALNLADNTVYEPFFKPFFSVMSNTEAGREDELQNALVRFLASDPVNERTDDDKSLALAVFSE